LYSEKTGRFYIYPTTDGFPDWGSYTFNVFSSPDLVNWIDEGEILDLKSNQVPWATGNAWAPTIIEKNIYGNYKYFFYFSGNAGTKNIGVAVANTPTGPFIDSGSPLISQLPSGVSGGQLIDADVFEDPISGKNYLYYGNGFMAVAELNDDMVSIKPGTTSVITPSGGNLSTYAYREGAHVFYRNGLYYFLWSVDDTGSANYHVAYGTSTSPTGPINVANQPIVIIQDPENNIYGTGHNSIIKIPGKDEWYIVYHRINADYLGSDPGTHREVCIDRLNFNPDGTIVQITPTRQGINPVVLDHVKNALSITKNSPQNLKLIKREIYNFSGQFLGDNITHLKNGLYIIKEFYENGSVSTRKIYKQTKY
jgi:beta-xylosidase